MDLAETVFENQLLVVSDRWLVAKPHMPRRFYYLINTISSGVSETGQ